VPPAAYARPHVCLRLASGQLRLGTASTWVAIDPTLQVRTLACARVRRCLTCAHWRADIAFFGVLRAVHDFDTFKDVMANTTLQPWCGASGAARAERAAESCVAQVHAYGGGGGQQLPGRCRGVMLPARSVTRALGLV
jgi:hypothetical protein